jgi:hypothetical protein
LQLLDRLPRLDDVVHIEREKELANVLLQPSEYFVLRERSVRGQQRVSYRRNEAGAVVVRWGSRSPLLTPHEARVVVEHSRLDWRRPRRRCEARTSYAGPQGLVTSESALEMLLVGDVEDEMDGEAVGEVEGVDQSPDGGLAVVVAGKVGERLMRNGLPCVGTKSAPGGKSWSREGQDKSRRRETLYSPPYLMPCISIDTLLWPVGRTRRERAICSLPSDCRVGP